MILAPVPTYTPSPMVTSPEILTEGIKAEYFLMIVSWPTVQPRFIITKSSILMLVVMSVPAQMMQPLPTSTNSLSPIQAKGCINVGYSTNGLVILSNIFYFMTGLPMDTAKSLSKQP